MVESLRPDPPDYSTEVNRLPGEISRSFGRLFE